MSNEWPPEPGISEPAGDAGEDEGAVGEPAGAPREDEGAERQAANPAGMTRLLDQDLVVPIRSSSGELADPARITIGSLRHGTDQDGRFLAAFTDAEAFSVLGPLASDSILLSGRDLFERAERADERVILNPGSPDQIEVPAGVLPFLLAGIDLTTPEALRARRPLGGLPALEIPASIPEPFGAEMRAALAELPAVERAWLLRVGTAWTVGVQLDPRAPLSEFDAVRNRLHALASEHLGSRRDLIVTDLRSPSLRAHYEAAAAPFYEPAAAKGLISRLFGRG